MVVLYDRWGTGLSDRDRGDLVLDGEIQVLLHRYDFSRHRRVADIAGGGGHLLTAVLAAHPTTSGVLFELPHVAATVPPAPASRSWPATSSPTHSRSATPTC